jgi:hypothetical protein
LAIDQVDTELVAHDASDITEKFLESIEDQTNTYYSNPPHRQAAIPKCLAITPPKTSKPKDKPKLKVFLKFPQRAKWHQQEQEKR